MAPAPPHPPPSDPPLAYGAPSASAPLLHHAAAHQDQPQRPRLDSGPAEPPPPARGALRRRPTQPFGPCFPASAEGPHMPGLQQNPEPDHAGPGQVPRARRLLGRPVLAPRLSRCCRSCSCLPEGEHGALSKTKCIICVLMSLAIPRGFTMSRTGWSHPHAIISPNLGLKAVPAVHFCQARCHKKMDRLQKSLQFQGAEGPLQHCTLGEGCPSHETTPWEGVDHTSSLRALRKVP